MNEQTKQRIEENRAKHLRPADGANIQWLSLASMTGKKIIDLEGYVSQHFGFDAPIFRVCNIVLEDGTRLDMQGTKDSDIAYITTDDVPGLTDRDLLLCFDPVDIDEEDDEEFQEYLDQADEEHAG